MAPKCGGKNHTITKRQEDSFMNYKENEDIFYRVTNFDQLIKQLDGKSVK